MGGPKRLRAPKTSEVSMRRAATRRPREGDRRAVRVVLIDGALIAALEGSGGAREEEGLRPASDSGGDEADP